MGSHPTDLVEAATAAAARVGFAHHCTPEVGRLLAFIAAHTPHAHAAESGTGVGVGTAWIASGLDSRSTLTTVECDPERAGVAAGLTAGDPRITVLTGDWTRLMEQAPYDLLFCDGGGKAMPDATISLLTAGGILVLDDFTPQPWGTWPPLFDGRPDELRMAYLSDPRLDAVEVRLSDDMAAIVAVRR